MRFLFLVLKWKDCFDYLRALFSLTEKANDCRFPLSRFPFFFSDDASLLLTEDLNTSISLITSERSGWALAPFLVAAVGLGVVVTRDVVVFGLGVGVGSI